MNGTEHNDSDALPLAAAAARLGISSDALRMRINRGKIRGFKRGGRLFAVLEEVPDPAQRTAPAGTEQTPDRFEQARARPASVRSPGEGPNRGESSRRAAAPEPGEPPLPLVVEFQKVELTRLLRDNSRLNRRLDQVMDELRHHREMQQREQVLRQQDQALRQRTQALIERLTAAPLPAPLPAPLRPPLPPVSARPASGPPPSSPIGPGPNDPGPIGPGPIDSEGGAPKTVPTVPDAGPSVPALGPEIAAPGDVPGDPAEPGGVRESPDLAPQDSTYAYGKDAAPPAAPPAPPPEEAPGPPNEPGESWQGARRDTAELANMLKDIGASLRALDLDAAAGRAPPPVPGARRTPGDLAGPPSGPPSGPPADDEAGLLEILGRMGPSAEERRTAARLMKRLLKGRAPRRRGEPGDDAD